MDNEFKLLQTELKALREIMDTKLEQVLKNQDEQTRRINKRELEGEDLGRRMNRAEREIDSLKASKATMTWVVAIGIAGAGAVGAILAAIVPSLLN